MSVDSQLVCRSCGAAVEHDLSVEAGLVPRTRAMCEPCKKEFWDLMTKCIGKAVRLYIQNQRMKETV